MNPSKSPYRKSRRRLIALTTASALVAGLTAVVATATQADATQSTYSLQKVQWSACVWYRPDLGGVVPECATVTVPRDWRTPGQGEDLSIAISRTKATDAAKRKGIVFTNPGGPSGSGITLSWMLATAQPSLAAQYDVIGMDPRGVGQSTQLVCQVDAAAASAANHDSRDLSAPAIAARHTLLKAIADGCATNPLTPYINTWQTTHDMDLIRAVLGERRLNYVGYSYGSWLGAKYAALFPSRAGKLVLDSNTGWMGDLADAWERMPMAFQRRWERQFVPWANRSDFFAKDVGTTPAQVNATYEQVRTAFIKYAGRPTAGDTVDGIIRGSLYTDDGFVGIGYTLGQLKVCLVDNQDWSPEAINACALAYLIRVLEYLEEHQGVEAATQLKARVHSAGTLLTQPEKLTAPSPEGLLPVLAAAQNATGPTVPLPGVYYAVRCGDGGNWHSTAWWDQLARRDGPRYPLAAYAIPQEVCPYWSLPAQKLPNPDPRRLGPLVSVQSEFDPATSYELTNDNLRRYPARLLAVDDSGIHGLYGVRGQGCVDDVVNAYFLNNVVPPARTVCTATPLFAETQVYPQPGPVDRLSRPRPSRTDHIPANVRQAADQLIR
ncbi:alpha/beta hydrolase [Kribbella sp. NBC_01245]|uniref:alpha/beta fold hydrolase n=1 Tax=Kribbella sp. NBC_01245 TaxID=2903578 RepID=UPI002E2B6470|nr:alpha/beta fold hydrolase [Kribbella sp. NBC_01245]